MKVKELRKIIREELENSMVDRVSAQTDKYVVVDSEEPLNDEGPIFEGTKEETKNWWFEKLEGEDIGGYSLISKGEYENMKMG